MVYLIIYKYPHTAGIHRRGGVASEWWMLLGTMIDEIFFEDFISLIGCYESQAIGVFIELRLR